MTILDFDLDVLLTSSVDIVRERFPRSVAVFGCGSVIERPGRAVSDIDLVVLAPAGDPVWVEDAYLGHRHGIRVDAALYDPNYFRAVARNRTLFFYGLRDVRKLLRGRVLFDPEGVGSSIVSLLRTVEVDPALVRPIVAKSAQLWSVGTKQQVFTADAARAIELLVLATMHARREMRYSKHKYLLEDVMNIGGALSELIVSLAELNADEVETFAEILKHKDKDILDDNSLFGGIENVVRDAQVLIGQGHLLSAVFPLRYVALVILDRMKGASLRNRTLLTKITSMLLLGKGIPSGLNNAFLGAVGAAGQ